MYKTPKYTTAAIQTGLKIKLGESFMKVGDLVLCVWQPGASGVDKKTECLIPMKYTIKDEFGLITRIQKHRYDIMFPQLDGYTHWLSSNAFEVISESR